MANTFELISAVTVGSGGAATITFSSIPSNYTDLCLLVSGRVNSASPYDNYALTFNGVGGTSYSQIALQNEAGTVNSYSQSSAANINPYFQIAGNTATANTFGSFQIYIPNYAGSANKSLSIDGVTENNSTAAGSNLNAGLFSSSSAISSITIDPSNGNFVQYSTAYLYGVKNA